MDEHYMGASTIVISGLSDPETLEALACSEALTLAHDVDIRWSCIASQYAAVVHDISEGNIGKYGTMNIEISRRRSTLEHVEFKHEMRESNWEAHRYCKRLASVILRWHIWLLHPPDFVNVPIMIQ